jgi:hypothetical protein
MAKLIDPDDLNQNTEVKFNLAATSSGTIQLLKAGNLSDDGVTLQCVYSFTKEEWRYDTTLIKYPFPFVAITEESMELQNDWSWYDSTSKELIRDGGWAWKDSDGNSREEYMNLTTLGSFADATDQAYYIQTASGIPSDFVYDDAVNEAVQIYGDAQHGNFDYRSFFKVFLREYDKNFDSYDLLTEQNLSTLTYKKYALPLSNSADVKVTHTDVTVSGSAPYTDITIKYYDSPQGKVIGGTTYYFDVIIDAGSTNTLEQVYERCQYELRLATDINDHTTDPVRGDTAGELLTFVGDTLYTLIAEWVWLGVEESGGVFIDNILDADLNRIYFSHNNMATATDYASYPYTAAGSINFNTYLQTDPDAHYWMYFTTTPSGLNFGTTSGILVQDNDGYAISGTVGGASSVSFTFDYDGNIQGGRDIVSPTDPDITIVAIGLDTAQYVLYTGSIARSKTNSYSLVAALERNYANA